MKPTIGDWTADRLSKFVQGLPQVQRRLDTAVTTPVSGLVEPTSKTVDDTIRWTGFEWVAQKITNAMVATGAAITYAKLTLTNSVVNADIASAAAIAYSKLNLATSIVNADVSETAAIRRYKTVADTKAIGGGAYTHLVTDDVLLVDASGGTATINLVAAGTAGDGYRLTVKATAVGLNTVVIDGSGAETIDGAGTHTLTTIRQSRTIVSDGSNWHIVSAHL